MSSIIELCDVWKTYVVGNAQINALQGMSLKVMKGDFLCIQGPSGSGKSTAMNMIGCLDIPSKGTVFLDGKNISLLSESNLAQIRGRKIGFIFQTFNLVPTLSALENVALPMVFQGTPPAQRNVRAKELLELVEMSDRMSHKPGELSGGQRQRVAIARSLANNPELILADEPTGNLDSHTGEVVIKFLQKLNREQRKTIVLVTHDQKLGNVADRTITIKDGRVMK